MSFRVKARGILNIIFVYFAQRFSDYHLLNIVGFFFLFFRSLSSRRITGPS